MRRAAFVLALVLLCGRQSRAPAALAVYYAPGWNLISGPEGSRLIGAIGSIYTLQPGDSEYEVFPAASALSGGYGYWAYFPDGGGLAATLGSETYATTLAPDQWVLLGNPNANASAALAGALSALAYIPEVGYLSVTSIPVGQGVWALGAGDVSLRAPPGSAPPASPLAIAAFVDPLQTTTSYLAPGALVVQVAAFHNGRPAAGATVSGTIFLGVTPASMPFEPLLLTGTAGDVVRFATPVLRYSMRVLIHLDVYLDGLTASAEVVHIVLR